MGLYRKKPVVIEAHYIGDDEDRISAFIEACGPDLIERARTVLAELEKQ
jgi:hypothetical protein